MTIEAFLSPIDGTNPSGIELRNDARFHAIERRLEVASRKVRMQQIEAGNAGTVQLDWTGLIDDARDLAGSGRDLRLLVIVVRALANDAGFAGLAEGLRLLTQTVAGFWESVHPMLRDSASKREGALRRINALYQIENPDDGMMGDLEFNTVFAPRGLGPISGGDLAVGTLNRAQFITDGPKGLSETEMTDLLAKHEARVNRVTAACRATAAEQPDLLAEIVASLTDAQAALKALEAALDVYVMEHDVGVRFATLDKFLSRVAQTLAQVTATAPVAQSEEEAMAEPPAPGPGAPPPAAAPAPISGIPGQITTRQDVERCLDMIIDFYERSEPSSPIPQLARRMRKMVPMNFMQLMEEIAPSGMTEFRNIAGVFEGN